MKKILAAVAAAAVLFGMSGCVSTSEHAFGNKSASSVDGVSVYTDAYSGNRTFQYTAGLQGKGFALSRGFSADYLEFFPSLVVTEGNACTPNLEVKYIGAKDGFLTTGADKTYNRFIFMNEQGKKLELVQSAERNLDINTDVDVGSSGIVSTSTHYDGSYLLFLTKSQLDKLSDFFSNTENVSCAAYSTDNKVVTFKSYNNKWHRNCFKALIEAVEKDVPNVVYNQKYTNASITER